MNCNFWQFLAVSRFTSYMHQTLWPRGTTFIKNLFKPMIKSRLKLALYIVMISFPRFYSLHYLSVINLLIKVITTVSCLLEDRASHLRRRQYNSLEGRRLTNRRAKEKKKRKEKFEFHWLRTKISLLSIHCQKISMINPDLSEIFTCILRNRTFLPRSRISISRYS